MRILLISQSKTDSGVPVWNRHFMERFPSAEWWCWNDFPEWQNYDNRSEPEKVMIFTKWLLDSGVYKADCPIIADGFWGAPINVDWLISVAHGIWDHDRGDFQDNFQFQHSFWENHISQGRTVVAVSPFIQSRFKDRWGWDIPVIGNSIDLSQWSPIKNKFNREKPIVLHGIKETNDNRKGSDVLPHIIERLPDFEVLQLNEACDKYGLDRATMLANADVVLTPTRFEANSYFMLEALACDVPVVSFATGLLWNAPKDTVGIVANRFSAEVFADAVKNVYTNRFSYTPRKWVSQYSLDYFEEEWTKLLSSIIEKNG